MMKRIIPIFLILVLGLAGCGNDTLSEKAPNDKTAVEEATSDHTELAGDKQSGIDVDITEKMYVTYINEIYLNTEDYLGKTIRLQGMYKPYIDENTGLTYYYVYRTGPGCCGNDGDMCGFEFTWDGDMPKDDDWIEVVGSLRSYEDDDGWVYLTLDSKSVTIMEERGAESVYQ